MSQARPPGERNDVTLRVCRKPVLSLDTSYLSNLARARHGEGLPLHVLEAWTELLHALTEAVWDDRLVCPAFNVQVEEVEMDDRIAGPAWVVLRSLSLGLAFHTLDGIVARQVEDVARRFLQLPSADEPPWRRVVQSDPDLPATEMSRQACLTGPFLAFNDRNSVQRHRQGEYKGIRESLPAPVLDTVLHGTPVESRLAFARLVVGRRLRDALLGSSATLARWSLADPVGEWIDLASRLRAAGMGTRELLEFLASPWLAHVPYVDLYCALARAAAHVGATGRPGQPSDEADRCIVSALFPYCSLMTTDRFVKHLVTTELHLDAQYGCQVFSGKMEDVRLLTDVVRSLPAVVL
ncbi:MAG TPA: hypothetical protein ENL12_03895 [Dehalococcoidia bacterium]|nr:hypothetical protein [Dehalococcoidia bacterium]